LRTVTAARHRRPPVRWLRPHALALRLAGCMVCVSLATGVAGVMAEGNLIWVANGVLLAYFLLAPRRLWPAYLCAGLLGHAIGTAVIHVSWQVNLMDTPLDVFEAFLGALLMRRRSAQLPRFTQGKYLLRFFAFAVLLAPLITGILHTLITMLWQHTGFSLLFLQWVVADSLGACVVTPACVAIFRTRIPRTICSGWNWAYLIPFAGVTIAVLSQARVPLSFVLYPFLVVLLLRLGLGWAATATLFVAAVGSWFTVHGEGPFASSLSLSRLEPAVILQLFVATAMFMLYSVSVVIENLRGTERRLQEIASLHKLMTENSRDVIIIADFEGRRSFVSAAGANWGGWTREEMLNLHTLELVHPDERSKMAKTILELRFGKNDALAECRVRTREGKFLWVETSLRTIRDPVTGVPTGILNNMREITQRKLAEQQLAEAYRAVEVMAITDALTGLANRRQFDQCLTVEWRRGMRDRKPLSLLLIDADFFKEYNDAYGHLRGDDCLKQIAEAIQDVVLRPGDLVARFGGEEFAVILPNTSAPGAFQVALDICTMLGNRQIPHSGNSAGIVTISAGSATLVPKLGQPAATLVDCADQALYRAKRSGRNRVCAYLPGAAREGTDDNSQDPTAKKSA
jgi:diguanylate cyclase (GGDEF)-like protein/PAS domain S-box-containing protein